MIYTIDTIIRSEDGEIDRGSRTSFDGKLSHALRRHAGFLDAMADSECSHEFAMMEDRLRAEQASPPEGEEPSTSGEERSEGND